MESNNNFFLISIFVKLFYYYINLEINLSINLLTSQTLRSIAIKIFTLWNRKDS